MSEKVVISSYTNEVKELRNNLVNMLPEQALEVFDQDAESLQKTYTSILQVNEGDSAPEFSLPNALGNMVSLTTLLEESKIVLLFYRGSWCPYCNLQLNTYQKALQELKAYGATLVAISPQTPDESLSLKEKNELQFEVLSDAGNSIAKKYTTVFKMGDAPLETMVDLGFDIDSYYSDQSKEIPVPAVFIIEQDGTISYAKSKGGDYRNRVEVADVLNFLKMTS